MVRWETLAQGRPVIRRLFSSLPTFKAIEFTAGMNVVLAEKTDRSTQKQTRNSAGKSSIVEILHFLLGADAKPNSIFRNSVLCDHEFGLEIELGGALVSVVRSGRTSGTVKVFHLKGDIANWPVGFFSEGNEVELTNREWTKVLGRVVFGIPRPESGEPDNYRPTFRALFPYFARRASVGAFQAPIQHDSKQQPWDQQVMISYLLGLDWPLVAQSQRLRDRNKGLKALKAAAGKELSSVVGKAADLLAQVTNLENQVTVRREAVESFRVLPTFREHSERAEEITRALNILRMQHQADARRGEAIRQALKAEVAPKLPELARLYEEVGVILPKAALRRFDEVQAFHNSILANRQSYLQSELLEIEARIQKGVEEMDNLDRQRADTFRILKSGGALEDFSAMQLDLAGKEAAVALLKRRYETAKQLEATQKEIRAEQAMLSLQLQRATDDHEVAQKRAIGIISRIFVELYGHPGALVIDPSERGLEISVKLGGDRGQGVKQMEIFAFDLMLSIICASRHIGPTFLVHDSHLFDGVDSRQIATALMVAKQEMGAVGWQYIVLMNSDELPAEADRPEGFDVTDAILPVQITDATETGGLFGIRFD